jgi:hypothetical protein
LSHYKAEAIRLQDLVDEAQVEMKKMAETSKKLNLRGSLMDSSFDYSMSESLRKSQLKESSKRSSMVRI